MKEIVHFDMTHNAEADACDLLMEVDQLELLPSLVSEDSFERVCLYLLKCSYYVADTEELEKILGVTYDIYLKCEQLCDALRVAIKMDNKSLMTSCKVFCCCFFFFFFFLCNFLTVGWRDPINFWIIDKQEVLMSVFRLVLFLFVVLGFRVSSDQTTSNQLA